VIRAVVQRLEHLDPDLVAAVMALATTPGDPGATRHLKLLMREWKLQMTGLLQVLDEMTDPKMFILVSGRSPDDGPQDVHTGLR